MPGVEVLRTVVAEPDDQGIVPNAQFIHRVKYLPGPEVDLCQNVSVVPVACLPIEIRVRQCWQVRLRERDESEKRLFVGNTASHEVDRALREVTINLAPCGNIVRLYVAWSFALACFHNHRRRSRILVVLELRGVLGLISCIGDAVPLVESLIGWEAARRITNMPFAEHPRAVARIGEQLSDCHFPVGESI